MPTRKPQSPQEKALIEKARRYLPAGELGNNRDVAEGGFIVKEARGSKIYDFSGNEYIDYLLGSGPMVLGHAHPAVVQAVRDYLERGTTYFLPNEPAIQLAEVICEAVPCAEQVRFTTSGTDATFQCMRAARAYRKRDKVLKFEGGFHGTSDYALQSVTPKKQLQFPSPEAGSSGIPRVIQETMLVAPFNDLDATADIIAKRHDELACVIVEPLQRILAPAPGFLQGLREVTARYDIPLVFDEVVTGFRLAWGGAQEFYGVVPDLAALAKIVGGGYPLGVVAGRADIMKTYDAAQVEEGEFIYQVGTLNGNPVAATAGLATLNQLRKPGAYEKLRGTGKRLRAALQEAMDQAEIPAQVSGDDVCFDVYFTDQEITTYRSTLKANTALAKQFNKLLLERGILKGSRKFYMSLAHTEADIQRTIHAFKEVAQELRA